MTAPRACLSLAYWTNANPLCTEHPSTRPYLEKMVSTSLFFTTAVLRFPMNTRELMDLGSFLLVMLLVWTLRDIFSFLSSKNICTEETKETECFFTWCHAQDGSLKTMQTCTAFYKKTMRFENRIVYTVSYTDLYCIYYVQITTLPTHYPKSAVPTTNQPTRI